eukprot:TRINITY_DN51957_c0_g1_i1.p1 TRINITY_DN51957_c0_g1~~TRINITY_DN51957_c0_g1_i1.p1  ORF type:complete len:247 (-),score=56.44 TRINITY_DN51957_c0_g1_i1:127-867(-)
MSLSRQQSFVSVQLPCPSPCAVSKGRPGPILSKKRCAHEDDRSEARESIQQARTNVEKVTKLLRCLAEENTDLQQEKEDHKLMQREVHDMVHDMQKQNVELKKAVEELSSEVSTLRSAMTEMQLELVHKASLLHGFVAGLRWLWKRETKPMGKATKRRFRGLQCFERHSEDVEPLPVSDQEASEVGLAQTAAPAFGMGLASYRIAQLEGLVKDGHEGSVSPPPSSRRTSLGCSSGRRSLGSSCCSD